jgi:glutathione S-transferase
MRSASTWQIASATRRSSRQIQKSAPASRAGHFGKQEPGRQVIDVFTNENVRKPMLGMGAADPIQLADAEERFWPLAKLLNDQLAERRFLLGEDVTLADFVVAGAATYMERARIPINDYPHVAAWWGRLNAIEGLERHDAWAGAALIAHALMQRG